MSRDLELLLRLEFFLISIFGNLANLLFRRPQMGHDKEALSTYKMAMNGEPEPKRRKLESKVPTRAPIMPQLQSTTTSPAPGPPSTVQRTPVTKNLELEKKVRDLRKQVKRGDTELELRKKHREFEEAEIKELRELKQANKATIKELEDQTQPNRDLIKDFQKQVETDQATIDKLQKQTQSNQATIKDLQARRHADQATIEQLREQRRNIIQQLQLRTNSLQADNAEHVRRFEIARKAVESCKHLLQVRDTTIEELRNSLRQLQTCMDDLSTLNAIKDRDIQDRDTIIGQRENVIDGLRQSINHQNARIMDDAAALNNYRDVLDQLGKWLETV